MGSQKASQRVTLQSRPCSWGSSLSLLPCGGAGIGQPCWGALWVPSRGCSAPTGKPPFLLVLIPGFWGPLVQRGGEGRTGLAGRGGDQDSAHLPFPCRAGPGGPRLPLLSSPPRQRLPWTSPVPGRVQFLEVPPAAVNPKSGSLSYLMVLEARNPTRVSRAHIKVWAELVPPGGSRRESVSWPFPAAGGGARIPFSTRQAAVLHPSALLLWPQRPPDAPCPLLHQDL